MDVLLNACKFIDNTDKMSMLLNACVFINREDDKALKVKLQKQQYMKKYVAQMK